MWSYLAACYQPWKYWIFILTGEVKIHKLSKTSAELVIFHTLPNPRPWKWQVLFPKLAKTVIAAMEPHRGMKVWEKFSPLHLHQQDPLQLSLPCVACELAAHPHRQTHLQSAAACIWLMFSNLYHHFAMHNLVVKARVVFFLILQIYLAWNLGHLT